MSYIFICQIKMQIINYPKNVIMDYSEKMRKETARVVLNSIIFFNFKIPN